MGCDGTPFFMRYLLHPVTIINLLICGSLGVIEFIHTKAHHTIEQDVHGHVHRALQKIQSWHEKLAGNWSNEKTI